VREAKKLYRQDIEIVLPISFHFFELL